MTCGAIIQARMSSRRLPGKVLLPIAGTPLLGHVLATLQRVPSLAGIVVATSVEPSDDPVAAYCAKQHVVCWRGPLENVAARFRGALEAESWDGAARITADSPLLDARVVEQAVSIFLSGQWDVVTNVYPRTYPSGQSVEIVSRQALARAMPQFTQPEEFEHVMPYFYAHAGDWRIFSLVAAENRAHVHLAVDTPQDLARVRRLLEPHG